MLMRGRPKYIVPSYLLGHRWLGLVVILAVLSRKDWHRIPLSSLVLPMGVSQASSKIRDISRSIMVSA